MGLLAFVLVVWAVGKFIGEVTNDGIRAVKGQPPKRVQLAEAGVRQGFGDYLGEVWNGFWEQRARALAAARAARPVEDEAKVRLRDRVRAARDKLAEPRIVDHGDPRQDTPPQTRPAIKPNPATVPDVGTVRYTDRGREQWDGKKWIPVVEPVKGPVSATGPAAPADSQRNSANRPAAAEPRCPSCGGTNTAVREGRRVCVTCDLGGISNPNTASNGGNPMQPITSTVPSGEAVTIPQAVEQTRSLRLHATAFRERTIAALADLRRSAETLAASAAAMEANDAITNSIAQAQEAIAAATAAVNASIAEVDAALAAVASGFGKQMPGVELAAATGGLANKDAYRAA